MNIDGKNIILTGASSGIGRELLEKLQRYDVRIIAVARNVDTIDSYGEKVIPFSCDISKSEKVDELFEFALHKLGKVDIFIANAGFAYCEEIIEPDWEHNKRIYDTDVLSPIYSAQKMKAINGKKEYFMVITCSAVHNVALPGYTLYCSAKSAIHQFARTYRYEMKNRGKLALAYPVATNTKFFRKAGGKNAPVPWPVQSPSKVADKIIKGIEKDKDSIYPSAFYSISEVLNRIFPLVYCIYENIQADKFEKWLKNSR
ncbi:SDR family NAD(P)-dependent oxidoreductase [Clostridium tyrobutyricum]|jgi:short-subunit dehydrogenase|uniref:SDR family NAD(P)-dependent oxidoreductase n=1 Tax=Clostridium tyrobutyricum TaxID=1519 RepID=UPI0011CAD3F9|nr:SDR family NAD(P)-dependent oxidoreductase [Clostridium tyrobutyricum]MBV4416130.1 SDR family NAD(P)-dependent oxidoreductase [Clostridium tyrobutyricum]MBV4421915.1 SDR family NAD(P)-dependent oxidoreductase [Clostridium tyrobutyricum]MBV4424241.1 SDR family NAD(P)-dependent oxidoreductase [Clostridium tyrobutyricum]MBV4437128.1 SDR family NAD(P)-dependent oxidoreductase [Clostridium tyrobutyricum]